MRRTQLDLALGLLACGPQRESDPKKWIEAAFALSPFCEGREDCTEAALRITASCLEELRAAVRTLRDAKGRHNTQTAYQRLIELLPDNAGHLQHPENRPQAHAAPRGRHPRPPLHQLPPAHPPQ